MDAAAPVRRHPPAASVDWDRDVRVLGAATLARRRAIVTGAGTGIGQAIAVRLCALGAEVVGMGRRQEKLENTAALVEGSPGTFSFTCVDLRDADRARAALAEASAEGLDVLVNNAGGQFYAGLDSISDRGFRSVVDLNLNAVFTAISACRPALARRGGSIVSISLSGVDRGSAGIGHSAAARAGVLALTRTLALEWAHLGIRANCIGPGVVLTGDLPAEIVDEFERNVVSAAIPAGRATPAEDVAELVCYLASPAGRMLSGQMLHVDGAAHLGAGLHMLEDWPPLQHEGLQAPSPSSGTEV